MEDFKVLKFLDKLKPIFDKLGVDYSIMRKIIQVKLLMDGRRVPTVFNGNNKTKKNDAEKKNQFLGSLGIYALMGIMLIPFVLMKSNYIFQMSIVFGIIMFFIISSLISDFSSVLLDVKDKNIIGTKPVDLKTIRLAKTIHVSIYMFYITAALVGPALLVSIITQGFLFFALFLMFTILIDLFCIVLTALVYSIILRFFDGEKLKDIINYVQISLSIVITIGYQLIGRLFNVVNLNINFEPKWWQYLIIPVWFSAPFQMLKKAEVNLIFITFTILAIVVPILTVIIYIKKMPEFEKNLNKLSNHYQNKKNNKKDKIPFFANILCRTKEERIFFRFASDIMKQEREFKLKVYPTLGLTIVFPFIFIFQQFSYRSLKEISQGRSYLTIYLCSLLVPTIVTMIQYSEKYKGAWIYKVIPIEDIASVFKGTIKAVMCKLVLPIFFIESTIFTVLYGARILPDLLLVFLNVMIYMVLCFGFYKKSLPFSRAFEATQNTDMATHFLLLVLLAVLVGIHFALTYLSYGVYINLGGSLLANVVLWRMIFRIAPEKLYAN